MCVVVLQLFVHERDAGQHKDVGRQAHELRRHRVQLPRRQRDRQAADQGNTAAEIPLPGMPQLDRVVGGPRRAHGGAVGVHREVRGDLRRDAAADGGLPRRPGSVPRGRRPGQSQVVQRRRQLVAVAPG